MLKLFLIIAIIILSLMCMGLLAAVYLFVKAWVELSQSLGRHL